MNYKIDLRCQAKKGGSTSVYPKERDAAADEAGGGAGCGELGLSGSNGWRGAYFL